MSQSRKPKWPRIFVRDGHYSKTNTLRIADAMGRQLPSLDCKTPFQLAQFAAAEFNVCRWLCCRTVEEERADAIAHFESCRWTEAGELVDEFTRGEHVGAARKASR